MFDRISDRWQIVAVIVLFAVCIAVADMNWPEHMGGDRGALLFAIKDLLIH